MAQLIPGIDITYEQAISSIYKGSSSVDQINDICNQWGVTPYEFYKDLKGGTAYNFYQTSDGTITAIAGVTEDTVTSGGASALEQAINSNAGAQTATKVTTKTNTPVNTSLNSEGKVTLSTQMKNALNTPLTNGKFSVATIGYAAAAAGVGLKLGKAFDSTLYNANPDFFDEHGMSTLNPDTWATITSDISEDDPWYVRTSGAALNTILGIDTETGESTMYMDEDAIAYMAAYLQQMNALEGETVAPEVVTPTTSYSISNYISATRMIDILYAHTNGYGGLSAPTKEQILNELPSEILQDIDNYTALFGYNSGSIPACDMFFIPVNAEYQINDVGQLTSDTSNIYMVRLYYSDTAPHADGFDYISSASYSFSGDYTWMLNGSYSAAGKYGLRGWSATSTAIEGISTQSGATVPDLSGLSDPTDISEVLAALKAQLPDLFNDADAIKQTIIDEDGNEIEKVYFPVPMPSTDPDAVTQPTGSGEYSGQTNPSINPDTVPENFLKNIIQMIMTNPDTTPNPTDTGEGTTPAVIPPSGTAGALFAVYNPTQSQVNDFGAWLWSSNFVDQLLKVFSDPMQAIISLHKVFCTPSTGGSQNIHVGYLDSGVSSATVSSQYVDVSCGSITLSEVFGNVFDYTMTHISIYLPFIGIIKLDTADAMRGVISVTYHVDVLTGACLADVEIVRDMGGGVLYQYSGDCAVHYPLSSGSYMGIISGILSVAGGIAGTVATGGAAAPVLIGAAGAAMNAHTDVARSGGFTGNAGAMGSKIPYIIISRPQTAIASNYLEYEGVGSNQTVLLSACSGYVKIKEVQLKNIPALDNELDMIRGSLLEGVII